jgi:AraC-like DNA-binding protein
MPSSPPLLLERVSIFSADEDVAIILHEVSYPTALHIHAFFEIVYIEEGRLLHRYGAYRHEVAAGDLFIVSPHIPHGYDFVAPPSVLPAARLWNVLLTEDALAAIVPDQALTPLIGRITGIDQNPADSQPIRLPPAERAIFLRHVKEMQVEYQQKESGYRTALHGHAAILLTLINRVFRRHGRLTAPDARFRAVGQVIRFIMEHSDSPLRVEELARQAGWSPEHLNRLMREVTGDTVQEYIGRVRTSKAAYLLVTEDLSIDEIARRVGYSDARSFRRAFQRYYGVTPGAFRKLG